MTAPVIPILGGSTVNRKWVLEVNTGTAGAPTWVPVGGVTNFQPSTDNANWADDSDFGGAGYLSQAKTAASWSATATVIRKVNAISGITYDVGQEFLRGKAEGTFGAANSTGVRFSEWTASGGPRVQAYSGTAGVGWAESGGDDKALSMVAVTLTGQGQLLKIAHPYPGTPAVPIVSSATPLALPVAGGTLVTIYGAGFTGLTAVTGVKFAGTNATAWNVLNDAEMVAQAPAHAAGSGPIVLTNAVGPSTTGPTVTYS